MRLIFAIVLVLLCCASLHSPSFAEDELTCKEVLSNETFRDALTRNDGRDWRVFSYDVEGRQLFGLACDKADLDAHFVAGGWTSGAVQNRPESASVGPFGPTDNRFYSDTLVTFYHCKDHPFWAFYKRRCANSIKFSFFQGKITHITGAGIKYRRNF